MKDYEKFILAHYGTKPNKDLATEVNHLFDASYNEDSLRNKHRRLLKRPTTEAKMPKKAHAPQPDKGTQFKAFLMKAKTEKEIKAKFGTEADALLKATHEGLTLYTQRNNYHELVYILLPKPQKELKLLPKKFDFHIGHDDQGEEQPYLLVQVPDFKGKLIIAPLFDVHFGNAAHKHEKFLGYLRWIKETPNVYAILGGDLMETALDDGRGMSYDQSENPQTQLDTMTQLLAPIAHKILVSVPGNHEERVYKKTGIDVAQVLAERLKVPYFTGPVTMSLVANTYKWTFYIFHGYGNSQTKGGKANMAARPKNWTGLIHFFVSGHVHDCIATSEMVMIEDPLNCRLLEVKQWVVVAQSFLKWYKTYAYRAGYKPPAAGGVSMELYDNGGYKAFLTE